MKKILLTLGIALCAMSWAAAQDEELVTENGTTIVPLQGSFAFGIDATPVLTYVGGLFSDNHATTPTFNYAGFYGKYFLADNLALRGKVKLNFDSNTDVDLVPKIGGNPDDLVEDKTTISNMDVELRVGIEKRIGKTRLQGFYGAEIGFGMGFNNNESYTYGNSLSATNPVFRPVSQNNGTAFGVGANLFVGAEYFIAPGIALGGELGWGIRYSSTGRGETKTESWNGTTVETDTVETGGDSEFRLNNFGGSFTLTFYF